MYVQVCLSTGICLHPCMCVLSKRCVLLENKRFTHNFAIRGSDDSVGGIDEVQSEHCGARQTQGEEPRTALCHQGVDHLLHG